jgi:hypothetical protein
MKTSTTFIVRNYYPSFSGVIIALMMEAVSTCETSANFYEVRWRNDLGV